MSSNVTLPKRLLRLISLSILNLWMLLSLLIFPEDLIFVLDDSDNLLAHNEEQLDLLMLFLQYEQGI